MSASANPTVTVSGRDVILTRLFNAPRKLVFKAWTDPAHVKQWWGPKVFTTPVCEIDLRPGGAYRYVLRSPDGAEYPMHGVYLDIVKDQRIVCTDIIEEHPPEWKDILNQWKHDGEGSPSLDSVIIVDFEDAEGGKTKVTVTNRFKSEEVRDMMLKMMMVEGWTESLESLEDVLKTL